ncbi:PAS domain S-box protein [Flavobacterium salmonis]|uniref:Adaptive-response sensory-kinase SasA n=1 Tax=Flavobacterium salmonis TaxID=2654844 RepID=A0A6V6Z6T1_9FLAO|nr:PAS domain S-box protein [Flavobacterium salmonis]CAD0007309.1 Adaptive-response sensory-kinase SasA [Flavobacterium salmonis]
MDSINFTTERFNEVFPFYILFDQQMLISSYGKSLKKVLPSIKEQIKFTDYFASKRPFMEKIDAETISENLNQLVILECIENDLVIRGQFVSVHNHFLFIGSPWLTSVEEVKKNNLTISDFANYDPQLDLLQILKNQEVKNNELNELLEVNNRQREELNKDREELNRISLVASANKNAIVFTDSDAKIFWCNDAYHKITGFTKEDILGKSPIEVGKTFNTDKEAIKKMVNLFLTGESFDVEITHGRKDGSYFWTRTKGQPIYNKNGELLQYFAVIEDITDEKKKEEQLILLSLIAEKNINAVIISDKEGKIEWVNSSFTMMSGYDAEELIGLKPGKLLQGVESNPEAVTYLSQQIKKGEPFSCEIINYSKTGKKYWVKIQGQALYNKWGEISRFFAIEEDITERKIFEEQKEQLLASLEKSNNDLEEYAQIVSHDLKSPLRSINSLIYWIKEDNKAKLGEQSMQYLNLIEGKIEKMDRLIQGILTYSKINNENTEIFQPVNTLEVVENIVNTIDIPSNIVVQISERMPVINADKFRIHQLFQNLIGNAVIYNDKPEGIIQINAEEHELHYIFSVKDNGPGIAEEHFEKIFKTFQSLTNSEKSTGLGLSIVKKIVNYYKGKIWIESDLGYGTTFYIQLNK